MEERKEEFWVRDPGSVKGMDGGDEVHLTELLSLGNTENPVPLLREQIMC